MPSHTRLHCMPFTMYTKAMLASCGVRAIKQQLHSSTFVSHIAIALSPSAHCFPLRLLHRQPVLLSPKPPRLATQNMAEPTQVAAPTHQPSLLSRRTLPILLPDNSMQLPVPPCLSSEYAQLDADDPSITVSWLPSILLFGNTQPRDTSDPRYRALAKLKAVAAQHGIAHVTPRDYLLAASVHNIFLQRRPSTKRPRPPSPSRPVRADHVQLFHHMLRHAESIYGLPLNVASAPRVSLTKLTDRAIVCRRVGLAPSDLIVADFRTRTFLPAHYIAVDRRIKALVICIRGTANIVDSLTDFAATHDPLAIQSQTLLGEIVEGYGHTGMVRSARNLFAKIRKPILAALDEHQGYELLLTGHSMGAATAAFLALIMMGDQDFPRPTTFCIGPPPCMTRELADETASNTITLVNGSDVVPRLSVSRLVPFFATARYVSQLSLAQKAMIGIGIVRPVIDWDDLEDHNVKRVKEMKRLHNGLRLYLPGRVFQLVRKERVTSSDQMWSKLFKRQEVEVVPLSKDNFLPFKGAQRGMFISHAPFSYRANLMQVLKSMGSGSLQKLHAGSVLRHIFNIPVSRSYSKSTESSSEPQESLLALFEELGREGNSTPAPVP